MSNPENRADNEMITRRAAENEVFIVVVNHAGRFNGGSFAVGPEGELYAQLGAEAEVRVLEVIPNPATGLMFGWSFKPR
jgi:predicted amidohydrolase